MHYEARIFPLIPIADPVCDPVAAQPGGVPSLVPAAVARWPQRWFAALLLILVGAAPVWAQAPSLRTAVWMEGLSSPWDLAFLPDGTAFLTERCRGVSVRLPSGELRPLLGIPGAEGFAATAPDLFCEGQSGVLGVAVDPDFARNRSLYIYAAVRGADGHATNRVLRFVVDAEHKALTERRDLVTDVAYKQRRNAWGGAGVHSGGRIRFGPDGYLYVTTGDNHDGALPQDPRRLGGKVLRIDRAGNPAPGNGAPKGFDARIYAWGLRNVQGIDFRPGSGTPFIAEHGPNHSDEVTALRPGTNGGWDPRDRPELACTGGYCGYAGDARSMPMTDRARFPDAQPPAWVFDGPARGLGSAVFLRGAQWRDWDGRLLVGIMAARRLELLELDAAGAALGAQRVDLPAARYRSLVLGPDGALYVVTDAGEIWRVAPN